MRLLTKTTLYFLSAMVILLMIAGFYLFNRFTTELNSRNDKELLQDEATWIEYIQTEITGGATFILKTGDISIYPVDTPVSNQAVISDIKSSHGEPPYRQLSQVISIYGISYQIIIRKSKEQEAALIASTTKIILLVFLGLFIATILFNWIISKKLWEPFYRSLHAIRHTDLQRIKEKHFEKTNTKEFNELNAALNAMTEKIHSDFINMKEFTENAAHEMQTPLSAAQSKLELLLQNVNLPNEDVHLILDATTSLSRLAKLNQGLLLLAKIENHQYRTEGSVSLAEVTKKYLNLFSELMQDKKLAVKTNLENDFIIPLHPVLADSLISNLLGNAIKYNYSGGSIEITIFAKSYCIRNTTRMLPIPREKLFKRFASGINEENSNGLGLAIVKKIADTHNLLVTYHTENDITSFEIKRK
jgi:signal transduction histidine kinase